jgi:hypothetical protein
MSSLYGPDSFINETEKKAGEMRIRLPISVT